MLENIRGHSRGSIPPLRMPSPLPHDLCHEWNVSRRLPALMSIELVMPSNHLILSWPFLFLLSFFPGIKAFSTELALCIHWPKFWSFSFRISPSNEYSWLIFFRNDWFDLLAVQGTLKSSLAPQFESISFLVSLQANSHICIHDYGKNYSFDYTNLCQQSDVSAF